MASSKTTSRFQTRLPFAAREAMVWAYLAHQWFFEGSPEHNPSIFVPTEIKEVEPGSFRFFLSGGTRIWVFQERSVRGFGTQWNAMRIRMTWPDLEESGGKGEMVWAGVQIANLCRFHPDNASK